MVVELEVRLLFRFYLSRSIDCIRKSKSFEALFRSRKRRLAFRLLFNILTNGLIISPTSNNKINRNLRDLRKVN